MSEASQKATYTTTNAGIPVESDEHSLTVGADGPILLQDAYLIEKMAQFNRERVPERVVHAKGSGAYGTFEVTNDVSQFTKADVFQPGKRTEMLARFSTVAGEMGSPTPGATRVVSRSSSIRSTAITTWSATTRRSSSSVTRSSSRTSSAARSAGRTAGCATTTCSGTSGRSRPSPRTR